MDHLILDDERTVLFLKLALSLPLHVDLGAQFGYSPLQPRPLRLGQLVEGADLGLGLFELLDRLVDLLDQC